LVDELLPLFVYPTLSRIVFRIGFVGPPVAPFWPRKFWSDSAFARFAKCRSRISCRSAIASVIPDGNLSRSRMCLRRS